MILRDYQQEAFEAVRDNLGANIVVSLPTGSGKSLIIAETCRWACQGWPGTRILVLQHVKELVEQNARTIKTHWPLAPVGIYSAGLKRYFVEDITVASVQSIFRRPERLGAFDIIIVDEAHRIPHAQEGMYHAVFKASPDAKIVGLSATPYRLGGGLLTDGDTPLFSEIVAEIRTSHLVARGFLAPIRARKTGAEANLSNVHTRGGEFVAAEMTEAFDDEALTSTVTADILKHAADRKSIMVFACSVEHCDHVAAKLRAAGEQSVAIITGTTPDAERDATVNAFKAGRLRFLVNCDVLTTGFDAPNVDCIVLLRATKSPGLYVQIVGRGLRTSKATGKTDCLLLDYGGNVERHGPLDDVTAERVKKGKGVPPMKVCPNCGDQIPAAIMKCPGCNYEYPPPTEEELRKLAHGTEATTLNPMTAIRRYTVSSVRYARHEKEGGTPSLRVTYTVTPEGEPTEPVTRFQAAIGAKYISEWVCVEHQGYARGKAVRWLARRGIDPAPNTVDLAIEAVQGAPVPAAIIVREGKFPEILSHEFST